MLIGRHNLIFLTDRFNEQEQTVPHSQLQTPKLPAFRHLSVYRSESVESSKTTSSDGRSSVEIERDLPAESKEEALARWNRIDDTSPVNLLHQHFQNLASTREEQDTTKENKPEKKLRQRRERHAEKIAQRTAEHTERNQGYDEFGDVREMAEEPENEDEEDNCAESEEKIVHQHVKDFNARMAEQQKLGTSNGNSAASGDEEVHESDAEERHLPPPPEKSLVQSTFNRARPRRPAPEVATITIGDKVITTVTGSQSLKRTHPSSVADNEGRSSKLSKTDGQMTSKMSRFSQSLKKFDASEPVDAVAAESSEVEAPEVDEEEEVASEAAEEDAEDGESIEEVKNSDAASVASPAEPSNHSDHETDSDYDNEQEKKAQEQARVVELIRKAEEAAAIPTKQCEKRAFNALKGGSSRDSTATLSISVQTSVNDLRSKALEFKLVTNLYENAIGAGQQNTDEQGETEERLSLTVLKSDFAAMRIVGQFNLGFILAVRSKSDLGDHLANSSSARDELFIIDQHASDEKYNFERLQVETVVGNQRLVRPATLDLTAVEEEIVIENMNALEKNGFIVDVDMTGKRPVGQRCQLISLPLSKEVVFRTEDLDELIHLLAESPTHFNSAFVPRPTKVRKMFAMRACRSSIMIGKVLSMRQMRNILDHMGTIDKPWNCPHGRPTMRHLTSLGGFENWKEGDGISFEQEEWKQKLSDRWREYASE